MRQVENFTFKKGGKWYYFDCFSFICEFNNHNVIHYLENRQMPKLRPSILLTCALS